MDCVAGLPETLGVGWMAAMLSMFPPGSYYYSEGQMIKDIKITHKLDFQ